MSVTSLGSCRFDSPVVSESDDPRYLPMDVEDGDATPPQDPLLLELAGPHRKLFFDPKQVRAGIVTCGGLCPGLNNVIRSIVLELWHGYGVREIIGFRNGYRGLDPARAQPPIQFSAEGVHDIHGAGGTILGTSRGPVDVDIAVAELIRRRVDVLFCIGGDGTQRGGAELFEAALRGGHSMAVVGIPKTIDNDVAFVTRSFGFTTAVEEARRVIECAHTEARSVFNGVGLVKLMGRHAGFVAAAATVASQDVNYCLIPESPFSLSGEKGLLAALERRLEQRHHAVIVVAEGAGQELLAAAAPRGSDASGNTKLQDIGKFLCEKIESHFKDHRLELLLRYFDPGYQIRSRPANTEDAVLCDRFARQAVHAAMAGKTGMIVGMIHGRIVYVPMSLLGGAPKRVELRGELWRAVLSATGQDTSIARQS